MGRSILAAALAQCAQLTWATTPTSGPAIGDIPAQALGKDGKGRAESDVTPSFA